MNCKLPNANQYILPATIRNYHLICGLVTSAGLLAFSAFMYGVAYMQHSSTVPCLVVGIIFTAFSVVYMVIWCSKYNLINAKFYADGYVVLNQVGSHNISILRSECIQNQIECELYLGYSKIKTAYLIFSRQETFDTDMLMNACFFTRLKAIWESGCVIIPISMGTEGRFCCPLGKSF